MPPHANSLILHGAAIIRAIKSAGVEFVLAVPDLHTSAGLLAPIARDPQLRLIRVCKEDECLGIAAGLSYSDKRAVILIQYTGMLYAMNAIRAIACEQSMPICMIVGLLGKRAGEAPSTSRKLGVRIAEPILDVLGVDHHLIEVDEDVSRMTTAINDAYERLYPIASLIGQRPSWP
jgi:sulfopyruvate decarboxylase subunit alpha